MNKSRLDDGSVLVAFELPAAVAATSVSLCGDFNGWSPNAHPLALLEDGSFRIEVPLPAGRRWRFRYLLDGERWENDWAADDYVPNGLGADDSIVDLTDVDEPAGAQAHRTVHTTDGGRDGDAPARTLSDAEGGPSDGRATPKRRRWRLRWWRHLTPA